MSYQTRTTRLTVAPVGEPIFSEQATHIEIDDESAGEFICVRQEGGSTTRTGILINPEEWPALRDAIETLLKEIRDHEKPSAINPLLKEIRDHAHASR